MEHAIVGIFRKALETSGAKQVSLNFTVPIGAGRQYSELASTLS